MAATRDIENELYAQIVSVLNAHADWGVAAANFIHYASVTGTVNPEKPNRHDGDYPQAILYLKGGQDQMYTSEETFQTYAVGGPDHWRERGEMVFRLELTSQLLKVTEPSSLCAETRNAFRKAGPRLGLDFVIGFTVRWETKRLTGDEDQGDNLIRWKSTLDVFVKFDTEGRDLRGD